MFGSFYNSMGPCLFRGGKIVNTLTSEIYYTDVLVDKGIIKAVGKDLSCDQIVDIKDKYLVPSFIDAHVHIESSMVQLSRFCNVLAYHGITTVVTDPHEIANVTGIKGINAILKEAEIIPTDVHITIPSCVPATSMETSGACLNAKDIAPLIEHSLVVGLGEVMNFPAVVAGETDFIEKINVSKKKVIDGHAPGLTGLDLGSYIAAGVQSDHECVSDVEAIEKLRNGMYIMVREGSAAKNLHAIMKGLIDKRMELSHVLLCSDDLHPRDLMKRGGVDHLVRRCILMGLDPIDAIKLATINPATYFGFKDRGAIAPGKQASFFITSDLKRLKIEQVYYKGTPVENIHFQNIPIPDSLKNTIVSKPVLSEQIILTPGKNALARVIGVIDGEIYTKSKKIELNMKNNDFLPDKVKDILFIVVYDRYGKNNLSIGLVQGFGLQKGALASSVAHDSHNIIAVGVNKEDTAQAINSIISMGGGLCAVQSNNITKLPLPYAGLMSDESVETVAAQMNLLHTAAKKMGCSLTSPFMTMSFLALPVIPELKITDKGLVENFSYVGVFDE